MKKILCIVLCVLLAGIIVWQKVAGSGEASLPVSEYYDYDHDLPLWDTIRRVADTTDYDLYYVSYRSVHDRRVTALLSLPPRAKRPVPVVILLHGLGDRKSVDYIEAGNKYFLEAGYAVFRIDICCHGDRKTYDWDFDLTGQHRYQTREMMSQTIFDLRRAVDFLETRSEVDAARTGFLGISLGGITGTIFCAVDPRIKAPVIVLAGGQMNLMFGKNALSKNTKDFLSIIDPINYVRMISPRPLLMINASNDDVVPPITSKLLYKKAKQPKKIIWYPAKHHTLPIDKTYREAIKWFDQYLGG